MQDTTATLEARAAAGAPETVHSLLLSALRRSPRPDRARIDAYARFAGSQGRYPAYHAFLSAHRAWLAALDQALLAAPAALGLGPAPHGAELPPEVPAGLAPPGQSIAPIRTRAQALGYLYVAEAFRLGGRVLARELGAAAVGHDDDGACDAAHPASRPWHHLAEALDGARPEEHLEVLAAASTLFAAWGRWIAPVRAQLGPN